MKAMDGSGNNISVQYTALNKTSGNWEANVSPPKQEAWVTAEIKLNNGSTITVPVNDRGGLVQNLVTATPIGSADELNAIRGGKSDYPLGWYYVQYEDIDLSSIANWTPIGNGVQNDPFAGIYEGRGKTIRNLKITGSRNYTGLFGGLSRGGVIRDITLIGASVEGGNMTGGISGESAGLILNCSYFGTVRGNTGVGGIAGRVTNNGEIAYCSFIGPSEGKQYTGGIAGQVDASTVRNSLNGGTISGGTATGGIAGGSSASGSSYIMCKNTGEVRGSGDNTGGIVGINNGGTIRACHNTAGVIGGGMEAGGVAGANFSWAVISASSNSGNVQGANRIGGIAGRSENAEINSSRNTGSITVTGKYVGGIIGYNKVSDVFSCYHSGSVTGVIRVDKDGAGGIIGWQSGGGTVAGCYSTGSVKGTHAAGIVGDITEGSRLNLLANYWQESSKLGTNGYHGIGWPANTDNAKPFGETSTLIRPLDPWPRAETQHDWGIGDGSGRSKYWKNLGSWNGGTNPVFPKLFWE
ncbi:hypothetical protein AGMMS50293_04640 [Spirochaetia bacterium]|nr:hypothetical protein AGMMS50293_04640 [Spirochaetia bacterium]